MVSGQLHTWQKLVSLEIHCQELHVLTHFSIPAFWLSPSQCLAHWSLCYFTKVQTCRDASRCNISTLLRASKDTQKVRLHIYYHLMLRVWMKWMSIRSWTLRDFWANQSQNHRIPSVGRAPQLSLSPTPGSIQNQTKIRPYVWEHIVAKA